MTSEEKKRVQYKRLIVDIKNDLDSVQKYNTQCLHPPSLGQNVFNCPYEGGLLFE